VGGSEEGLGAGKETGRQGGRVNMQGRSFRRQRGRVGFQRGKGSEALGRVGGIGRVGREVKDGWNGREGVLGS
jgi:hypothetical protein